MRAVPVMMLTAWVCSACIVESLPPDAGQDAGVDAGQDAGPLERRTWVLSSVLAPVNPTLGSVAGVDVDGDGTVDNGLVQAFRLFSEAGAPVQDHVDQAVARGEVITLMEASAHFYAEDAEATARLLPAESATPAPCENESDGVCGRHLSGDAGFTVSGDVLTSLVPAMVSGGRIEAVPEQLPLPIVIPDGTFWVMAHRAHVSGEVSESGLGGGRYAGAILAEDVQGLLVPAFHRYLIFLVVQDCTGGPGGGCSSGSTGQALLTTFDGNDDGQVSLEEFNASSETAAMFELDLDLTGDDGVNDALSFGFAFTAVGASF